MLRHTMNKMAIKSEVIDFKISCRCCLKSDAEFYKIDTFMIDDFHEKKISLLECLIYSTQCEDEPELPKYICLTCSKMLHIVYKFLQTAREAHEILCQKLCPERCKATVANMQRPKRTMMTPSQGSNCEIKRMRPNEMMTNSKEPKMFPYRCKVCGERMRTELCLKEHVRTHIDFTVYSCQLCSYQTHICQKMKLHYRMIHRVNATEEQLKLKVETANKSAITAFTPTSTPKSTQPLFQTIPSYPLQPLSLSKDTSTVQPTCTLEDIELLIPPTMIAQDQYHKHENQEKYKVTPPEMQKKQTNKQGKRGKQYQTKKLPESLLMATVINDPNDLSVPQFEENAPLTNELSVGTEFVVKSDGSVEQVLSNGVVIEYITAEPMELNATAQNEEIIIDNDADIMNAVNEVIEHMDIDEIIVEDPPMSETLPTSTAALTQRRHLKQNLVQNARSTNENKIISSTQITLNDVNSENQTKCVVCSKEFTTSKRLRTHLLCHKNLPKYFCDLCPYFTIISTELIRHYEAKHQQEPPNSITKEKNNQFYLCELCHFSGSQRDDLKIHYRKEHKVEPTHLQLRPSFAGDEHQLRHGQIKQKTSNPSHAANNIPKTLPDYPNGLRCALCPELFCWRSKYKEHLRAHVLADKSRLDGRPHKLVKWERNKKVTSNAAATVPHTSMASNELDEVDVVTTTPVDILQKYVETPAVIVEKLISPTTTITLPTATTSTQATELSSIPNAPTIVFTNNEQNNIDTATASTLPLTSMRHFVGNNKGTPQLSSMPMIEGQQEGQQQQLEEIVQVDDSANAAIFCDMQDFMNTSDVAAICTIPGDAIQVVESDDVVIDNNIDFNFNAESLFEGFEEDDEEEDVDDDDDDEDMDDDDDDVNDNNDAVADQNLLLTSDDDDLDDFDDEQAKSMQKPFCMHCNSKFTSQYQFENHMFLHRGLAPYRCEMCTNLYNTKRALLRHYRAVHERIPTRDMIQAKGDKVSVDRTPTETLIVDEQKSPTLMCAKCPYECLEHAVMLRHLNVNHDISDESLIVSKLPFECPRCIRSFATKKSLVKHLQRSHLVATIIEQTSSSATTTPSAATTKTTTSVPSTTTNMAVLKSSNVSPKMLRSGDCRNMQAETEQLEEILHQDQDKPQQEAIGGVKDDTIARINIKNDLNVGKLNIQHNNSNSDASSTTALKLFSNEFNYDLIDLNVAAAATTTVANKNNSNYESADKQQSPSSKQIQFQCDVCQCSYSTLKLLKLHMKRHVSREFVCVECSKSFVCLSELDKHNRSHEAQFIYKCNQPDCRKAFNYKHHLKRHKDTVHLRKRYICPLSHCGRQLTTNSQLKLHMSCHNGMQAPYKCPACDQSYSRRKSLRQHALKYHDIPLSDNDIAAIYCTNVGHTNPYDMKLFNFNDNEKFQNVLAAISSARVKNDVDDSKRIKLPMKPSLSPE